MRTVWVLIALLSTALAGCAEDAPEELEPATSLDEELVATDDTGIIRGIIVDDTITPVADVTVTISGSQESTTTNENGEFGFSDLEPSTYFLTAFKQGWTEVQQSVNVEAGVEKPPLVKIQMSVVPGEQPYNQGYQFDGFLGCSVRVIAIGLPCDYLGLGLLGDTIAVDYTLDAVPDWVVSEMTWESTQALGDEMSFNIRRTDTNSDTVDKDGPSPLTLTVNRTVAEDAEFGDGMDMRIVIFTAHLQATEPPCPGPVPCLWGVGVVLDQSFSVFTHVFYNYLPPQDWRFLEDPSVPGPA